MAGGIDGILLFDKPLGLTSAAAVARVKKLFGARKAGHTGSLDPLATGVLPICFGEATKFGAILLDADKSYRLTIRLGERTASADRETPVLENRELPPFTADQLRAALNAFPRHYAQVPPMHSALKQGGRPLYEYARAGEVRDRPARAIVIRAINFLDWQTPDLQLEVRCTKGAYMRVLAEDVAAMLETVGHLAELRRTSVSSFGTHAPHTLEALTAMPRSEREALLLPVDAALEHWPRLDLATSTVSAILKGQSVPVSPPSAAAAPAMVRLYAPDAGFLGLGQIEASGRLVPRRLIAGGVNRA